MGDSLSDGSDREERFRSFFDYSVVAMSIVDSEKRFVEVNRAYSELVGYDEAELRGKPVTLVMHPDDRPETLIPWDELMRRNEFTSAQDTQYVRKDGSVIWVRVTAKLFKPSDGTAPLVMAVVEHVTERRQAEQGLLEAHTAVELALEGISRLNDRGEYVSVNNQYAAMLGYRPDELVGRTWEITVHPDDRGAVEAIFEHMLLTGRGEGEIRGARKDGSIFYKQIVVVKLDSCPIPISGHYCFMRDITERKREEAFLAAEKQALELVAKGAGLQEVVTFICRIIEEHTTPMLTSIMLLTEDGKHLRCVAAPSLPDEYTRAVDGIPIGPTVGSCGSAAYYGKPSIVADIATDPLWKDYAAVALAHGLRACWSQPILSSTGTVLGTFAAYYKVFRTPSQAELAIVERAGHLAAVAIQHIKMSEALRESEERFEAFMKFSPAVAFIKDEASRLVYVNQTFERLFRVSLDDVKGKSDREWLPESVAASLRANDLAVLSSGRPLEIEETVPTPDGKAEHWLVLKFPLNDVAGRRFIGGVAIDITDRKQSGERVLAEKLRHEQLMHSIGGILWEADPVAFNFTYVSAAAERLLGYTLHQWLSEPTFWIDHIHPDDREAALSTRLHNLRAQGTMQFDYRMIAADGRLVWLRDVVSVISEQGRPVKLIGVMIDITASMEAQRRLKETEERWHYAFEGSGDGVWDWTVDTDEVFYSHRWKTMLGYEEHDIGTTRAEWKSRLHPDDGTAVFKEIGKHIRGETALYVSEHRMRCKDGTFKWILDRGKVITRDARGNPLRMVGTHTDLTEHKQAEAALRESEERLRALYDDNPSMYFTVSVDGTILSVNRFGARQLGYEPEELIGGPVLAVVHEDDREFVRLELVKAFADSTDCLASLELRKKTKDGTVIWVRELLRIVPSGRTGPVAFIVCKDISAHKQMEEALRRSYAELEHRVLERTADLAAANAALQTEIAEHKRTERRLRLTQFAVDRAPNGIFWVSPTADILYANDVACEVLGYSRDELLRMTVHDIDSNFPPEAWPAHWEELKQRGSFTFESSHRTKSGSVRYTEVTVNHLVYGSQEYNCAIVRDITERKLQETALLESEERFSKAFNESAIGMAIVATDGRWLQVNQALCEIVGYSKAELEASTFQAITHPDDLEADLRQLRQLLSGELRTYQMEKRYFHKNGSIIWIVLNVSLVRNAEGTPQYVIAQIQDITERKRTEDKLRATQYAVDHAADQIFVVGPSGRFLDVNEAACRQLGYTKDELLTMSVMDIDPDYPREVWAQYWEEFRQAGQLRLETRHRRKSGEMYPVEVMANYHVHNGQELDYAIVRDITERKAAEVALRESEARYRLLTDSTFDGVAIHEQGTLLEVNTGLERMFGYKPGELIGTPILDLVAEESRAMVVENMRRGVCGPYEAIGRRKDGTVFPGEIVVRPHRYRGRDVRLVAGRDITERKQTERALQFLSTGVTHLSGDAFFSEMAVQLARLLDVEIGFVGKLMATQPPRIRAIGLSIDGQAMPPVEYDLAQTPCERVIGKHTAIFTEQVQQLFPDDLMLVDLGVSSYAAVPLFDTNGRSIGHVGVMSRGPLRQPKQVEDMLGLFTVRAAAELARQRMETKFYDFFEFSPDATIMVNQEGRITLANRQAESLFGYSRAEFVGLPVETLMPEAGRDEHLELLQRFFSAAPQRMMEAGTSELRALKKDGTIFPIDISLNPIQSEDGLLVAAAMRDTTERKHLEQQLARYAEDLERQVDDRTAEIAKLESQRAQTERLAALGRLAAGVAHEINNPVAGIKNAFALVKQAVDPAHAQYEFVGMIDREIERVSSIVQNMYQLYGRESGKVDTIDLGTMIADIEALFAKQLQQRQLRLVVDSDLRFERIDAPRSDLLQVLLNLLNNAIDCSREGGTITMTIREEAEVIRIALADQGSGISPEVLPHIFDPFFTTKTEGEQKGMGLGLSISQSLVTAMGGRIDVHTQLGHGSTVSVLLPRHRGVVSLPNQTRINKEVMTHGC